MLAEYRRNLRRSRRIYAAAIAAVLVLAATLVKIAFARGELSHTHLVTTVNPPAALTLRTPVGPLSRAWLITGRPALGTPYWNGTVIAGTADSVGGHDARTGALTWSYTRTDRTVCQAIQDQGIVIAIFDLHGNCDEVTALDAGTGQRRWTRTLDEDGSPVIGHPQYSITADTIMITTSQVIYAIDPQSGIDRWLYRPPGCDITAAILGSSGALIAQHCAVPPCRAAKLCAAGSALVLRDRLAARDDQSNTNPDRVRWTRPGATQIPTSASGLVSSYDAGRRALVVYDPATGQPVTHLSIATDAVATPTGLSPSSTTTATTVLIWLGGRTYAVSTRDLTLLWTRPGAAAPSAASDSRYVASVQPGRVVLVDPVTGTVAHTYAIATDSRSTPTGAVQLGTGVIVTSTRTTAFYR